MVFFFTMEIKDRKRCRKNIFFFNSMEIKDRRRNGSIHIYIYDKIHTNPSSYIRSTD